MNKFSAWIGWYREASALKRSFIWGLVLGLIILCCFLNSNKYWPFYDGRFETYRVPIKIGDRIFAFPRNYLWAYKQADEGKKNGHIEIQLLMPGFEPITRENYYRFRKEADGLSLILNFDRSRQASEDYNRNLTNYNLRHALNFLCGKYVLRRNKDLDEYKCETNKTIYTNQSNDFLFQCEIYTPGNLRSICHNSGHQYIYGHVGSPIFFDAKYGPQSDKVYAYIKNLIETAKAEGEK